MCSQKDFLLNLLSQVHVPELLSSLPHHFSLLPPLLPSPLSPPPPSPPPPLQGAQCKTGDGLACCAPDSGGDRPATGVCNGGGGGAVDTMPQPHVKRKVAWGLFL